MIANRLQHDVFTQLLAELKEVGVTREQLFSQFAKKGGSDSISSDGGFLGTDALILLEAAVELAGDARLPLRLGQRIGIESYGAFGFALMSCANLRESTELLLRYGKVFFQPSWEVHEHDGGLFVRINLALGTPAQQQILIDLCFSQFSFIGSSLYRGQIEGAETYFAFSKPAHSSSYKSALKSKATFGADHNQFFLPNSVLDTPVKTANASDHVVFHQQCEEMLLGLASAERTTAEVRRALIQSAGDFPDIAEVAETLCMSERTLRRRLRAESTNFRETFEDVRDLLAKEYLTKTELTVAEIAHLLDYSETVNFRRAFVRWNKMTPSAYRQG